MYDATYFLGDHWQLYFQPGLWRATSLRQERRQGEVKTLKPGDELTIPINLEKDFQFRWQGPQTAPVPPKELLPPGDYVFTPTFSSRPEEGIDGAPIRFWRGDITAKPTAFKIAAANQVKADAVDDNSYAFGKGEQVQLGIDVAGQVLSFALKNVSPHPCSIMAYLQTHERHYDNLVLYLIDSTEATTTVHFVDSRNTSGPVFADLKPDELHQDAINLSEWFSRAHVRLKPKDGSIYRLYLMYDATNFAQFARAKRGEIPFAAGPVKSGDLTVKYHADKGFTLLDSNEAPTAESHPIEDEIAWSKETNGRVAHLRALTSDAKPGDRMEFDILVKKCLPKGDRDAGLE